MFCVLAPYRLYAFLSYLLYAYLSLFCSQIYYVLKRRRSSSMHSVGTCIYFGWATFEVGYYSWLNELLSVFFNDIVFLVLKMIYFLCRACFGTTKYCHAWLRNSVWWIDWISWQLFLLAYSVSHEVYLLCCSPAPILIVSTCMRLVHKRIVLQKMK